VKPEPADVDVEREEMDCEDTTTMNTTITTTSTTTASSSSLESALPFHYLEVTIITVPCAEVKGFLKLFFMQIFTCIHVALDRAFSLTFWIHC
jgi:hypothetical protein